MFGSFDTALLSFAPPAMNGVDIQGVLGYLVFIIGAFVVPFVLGAFLSRVLRMPNYGTSFGFILFSIIASALVISVNKPRYGVDIAGGTILKYELDKSGLADAGEQGSKNVKASQLIEALTQRLNPTGTKEIVIRPIGDDQIEIVVPNVDQMEIEEIKRIIQQAGILKFRIVANYLDHAPVIDLARKQAESQDLSARLSNEVRNEKGEVVGIWQTVGRDSVKVDGIFPLRESFSASELARNALTGQIVNLPPLNGEHAIEKYLAKQNIESIDLLMSLVGRDGTPFELVTGDDLAMVRSETGKSGMPEVAFGMNVAGAQHMLNLTSRNIPKAGNFNRMAIILDGQVLSAPRLNNAIAESGVIQGRFTKKEVDFLVSILRSGSLPAALGKQPIGQSQTGAMLGASTIQKGFYASALGLATTFIFMLAYYRFSGFIACIALLMNIVILYAFILLIRQPITLPGLAGFVLTVGMSVDANVLVYERIREEIARNATGRMAIRNGFDNAMSTIVDSNLTTLISGFVLYALGTDQVRGFAVPLILGIVISMFTAVFCSRIFFDVAEKFRKVSFSMSDGIGWARKNFLGDKDIDFMGMQKVCFAMSGVLIAVGLVATFIRGSQMLDIDFRGGTAVVFSINKPAKVDTLRELISKSFTKDETGDPIQTNLTNISVGTYTEGTVYRLETSLSKLEEVKKRLNEGFANQDFQMVTFRVDVKPAANTGASFSALRAGKLVSTLSQDPPEAVPTTQQPANANSTIGPGPEGPTPPANEAGKDPDFTTVILHFHPSEGNENAKIACQALLEKVVTSAKDAGQNLNASLIQLYPEPMEAGWTRDSMAAFDTWKLTLPFESSTANAIVEKLQTQMTNEPVWLSFDSIGSRVAGQMQIKAIGSLLISLIFINIYIWFRFHNVAYGLAAVVALLHDVLITLGVLAISHWIYRPLEFLMVEDFKLSLTVVAAFLTIIGYSLNDTIVVFDRIREVKGKSPHLTKEMINKSVNQTLGRTLLTSSTTIIAIAILYFLGGEGIHGFAFCLFTGIIVGTFSSIFVASPILLWMTTRSSNVKRQAA